jgi:hypothetical protein
MTKKLYLKKYSIVIGLLSLPFSLAPSYFTKILKLVPTVSVVAYITSKEVSLDKKAKDESTACPPCVIPPANNFYFSSLFVQSEKEQEFDKAEIECYLRKLSEEGQRCKENSTTCAKAQMLLAQFSYHPVLTNARKDLMVGATGKGYFTEGKKYADLKSDPNFQAAIDSINDTHMLPARPGEKEEDRPSILTYYMRELLNHNVCGTSIHTDFQKEFTALRECWKNAPHDSVIKLTLKDGQFIITSLAPKQGENCYGAKTQKDFCMATTPAFRHLFDTLISNENEEVYINRKDLSKFFADQITAEELFIKRNVNSSYKQLHALLSNLRRTGRTDFKLLHSLAQDGRTLLSD